MVNRLQRSVVTSIASAYPSSVSQEDLWNGFFSSYFEGSRLARSAFVASGIERRHAVANPLEQDISEEPTSVRMERFAGEATILGKEAVTQALDGAGVRACDIGLFVVVTCTGYSTPGIDIVMARDLDMSPSLQRVMIGHVGCHGALPGLQVAHNHVLSSESPALLLSVELPSLHLQPRGKGADQIIPHALFSDAAAALVLQPANAAVNGLAVIDFLTSSSLASMDYLTWQITDRGFRMTISRRLPEIIAKQAITAVSSLLERNGLLMSDVAHWAVHPGGPRLLDTVATSLGLNRAMLAPSDAVLSQHGNCSSATVLMVLQELIETTKLKDGDNIVALAFGPGLTCVATLLRHNKTPSG